MRIGWLYVTTGPDGKNIRIKVGKDTDHLIARQTEGGSLLIDTTDAPKKLMEILVKASRSEAEIQQHLEKVGAMGPGESVTTAGITTVLRPIGETQPDLSHPPADDRLFALMAYEYLYLVVGHAVFHDYFAPVVSYLRGKDRPSRLRVEHLRASAYRPEHRIYLEILPEDLRVNIQLFGFHVYRVTFMRLKVTLPDAPVYVEDLAGPRSLWAESLELAKQGRFRILRPGTATDEDPIGK